MWVDDHGSEVLGLGECRRLLALGAKEGQPGHLGIPQDRAPLVLPVDYRVHGPDVVLRLGDRLFEQVSRSRAVAFQVDGVQDGHPWSVLVRGPANEVDAALLGGDLPTPVVAEPGRRYVSIRADVVTGRRLR